MADTDKVHPIVIINQALEQRANEYKKMLPAYLPPSKAIRSVIVALQDNPDLVTANRPSLMNAVNDMMNDGLLCDGRQGVLVLYKTKDGPMVQWQPMVQGLLQHAWNSGLLKQVAVDVVREGETFEYYKSETGPHLHHVPGDDDTARITHAYAIAGMKDGGVFVEVMTKAAVDKRRASSKAPNGPMWRDWYQEAAEKTVLRALCKLLPSSNDDLDRMRRALDRDLEADLARLPMLPSEPIQPKARESVSSALDRFGGGAPVVDVDSPPTSPPPESNPAPAAAPTAQSALELDRAPSTPHGEAIAKARELGAHHRKQGMTRKALPPEYREAGREAEAQAWREGWDQPLTQG